MQLYKRSISSLAHARIVICVAVLALAAVHHLHAELCGTVGPASPPCVLTPGYAGPPTDANFNSRQAFNGYETTLTPSYVSNPSTMPTTHRWFLEVDDSGAAIPPNAPANPVMAQPLYAGNRGRDTVFAWAGDGTQAGNLLRSRPGIPSGESETHD